MSLTMEPEKIAVYFDGDGVEADDARFALEEIKTYGNIIICRVYRDWRNISSSLGDWQSASASHGIAQVQCGRVNSKESTDIKLCVDLMKDLYTIPHISLFYIITSDRDYRHVLPEVKVMNKKVHVIGPTNANPALISHCDKYSRIELLRRATIRKNITLEETNSNSIIDELLAHNTHNTHTTSSSTTSSSTTTSGLAGKTNKDLSMTSSPPKGVKEEDPTDSLVKAPDDSVAQKYNLEFDNVPDNEGKLSGPWFLAQLNAFIESKSGQQLQVSEFKIYLMRQATDFDSRIYGYRRFIDFLQEYVLHLNDEYELATYDGHENVYYIVRKKKQKTKKNLFDREV